MTGPKRPHPTRDRTAPDGRPDWTGRIAPHIAAVEDSGIVEIFNAGRQIDGVIPMWVGEGSVPTPAFIQDAAIASLKAGNTFYTHQRGIPALRAAVADYLTGLLARRRIDTDEVFITGSGMQAIVIASQMILGAGDEMAIVTPVWPNIIEAVRLVGARPVQVAMDFTGDRWRLDLEKLFAAVGPRTKALFVNSPSNPTGVVITAEEQRAILDFARQRGLWVIADEVYSRLVFDTATAAPSFLDLAEPGDRLFQVNSFSKNWAMTGWRMGWLIAPPGLGQTIENLIQYNTSGVPHFLQDGALAAITKGEAFVAETVARCARGRAKCVQTLGSLPRVRHGAVGGAFYFFFQVEGEPDAKALAYKLLAETKVGLAPGTAFGTGGESFLRLCFAAEEDRLDAALDRLYGALS